MRAGPFVALCGGLGVALALGACGLDVTGLLAAGGGDGGCVPPPAGTWRGDASAVPAPGGWSLVAFSSDAQPGCPSGLQSTNVDVDPTPAAAQCSCTCSAGTPASCGGMATSKIGVTNMCSMPGPN